jgi:tetratricopeptide (TPR) repeat protein
MRPSAPQSADAPFDPYAVFTVALQRAHRGSPTWHTAYAGRMVLVCADDCIAPRRPRRRPGVRKMDGLRRAVALVPSPLMRMALSGLVDTLQGFVPAESTLIAMVGYAQRLHKSGHFDLAVAVYRRIVDCAESCPGFDLATAHLRLGYCLRESGDFTGADTEFELGILRAIRYGEVRAALNLKIARASLACMRGNIDDAESWTTTALASAESLGDPCLIARAAHERGNAARERGHFVEALRWHERAMHATSLWLRTGDPAAREAQSRLLADIGVVFYRMGLYDHARSACQTVFLTSRERSVRWAACINLLALAAADNHRDSFDQHRATLDRTPLPARLLAIYLEELGDGWLAFNQGADAREAYMRLARLAEKHGLTRSARRAFDALRGAPRDAVPFVPRTDDVPPEVADFVAAVGQLSELPQRLAAGRGEFHTTAGALATRLRRGRRPLTSMRRNNR